MDWEPRKLMGKFTKNNCPEVVKQVATERIANIDKIYSVLFKYRT